MPSKSQIVTFISVLPSIALLPRFSRQKKYFYVVSGFGFTGGAFRHIIRMKECESQLYQLSTIKCMPGIKVSKCAVGTENFNTTTGNSWVYMVEMSRYHKKLMTFRKQKKSIEAGMKIRCFPKKEFI